LVKNLNKIAVVAYTTFSTDTRVQKEANAASELGFELDIYSLNDKNVPINGAFNFILAKINQYKGQSKINYVFSYFKFFVFCFYKLSFTVLSNKYKFIHIHNMPNFLVFSAIIPKVIGSKVILDIHDLMPEIYSVKFNLPNSHLLIRALYFEERISSKFANYIISTNSFHTERFRKNNIINKDIIEVVNVADGKIFYLPENKSFNGDELVLAYPSTLAKRLGIDNLLEAIELLVHKNLKIQLNIYGDGEYRNQIKAIVDEKKLQNVIHLSDSFISLELLSQELDKAHIGVIPLPSNVSNDIAMPVKIYEFFAKRICVVASDLPLLKKCFGESIVFFNSGDSLDLANKIEYLYNNRKLVEEFAQKGYNKFSSQTWSYYKSKYQSLLNNP
jgi:glycosyltransferase involved in cell wall biosynthesis